MPDKNDDEFEPQPTPKSREGRIKGNKKVLPTKNSIDKTLQGTAMMARRVATNATLEELGREFNVNPATVRARLNETRIQDIAELAKHVISEKLIVKAIAVISTHLDEGNYDAAKDLLNGMSIYIGKNTKTETIRTKLSPLDMIRQEKIKGAIDVESEKEEMGGNNLHRDVRPRVDEDDRPGDV